MMLNTKGISHSHIHFGVRCYDHGYSRVYEKYGRNGEDADSFVIKRLEWFCPDAKNTDVLDIGAGDGRNTIGIAKRGYNVTATEICPDGRELIKQQAAANDLNNVKISKQDILSRVCSKLNQFHFALMSHVSQHLDNEELNQVLNNVKKMLKPGGVFVFDALIRNRGFENLESTMEQQASAVAHFKESDIVDAARSNGFRIMEASKYSEDPNSHARYIHTGLWGGDKDAQSNKPLQLKWFVVQKKAD